MLGSEAPGEMNVRLYRAVFLAIAAVSVLGAASYASGREPYPAFIGPSFGPVQQQGRMILSERARVLVVVGGKASRVNLRKFLRPIRAPKRWIVQAWIRSNTFESEEARAWLAKRLRRAGHKVKPESIHFQWLVRTYDLSKKGYVGKPKVVKELRVQF
jgi:hypothetical protein